MEHRDWTWVPKDRVRSKVTPRNLGVGLNKRGMPRRFSRGWKVAWWGSVEKKEDSHCFGLRGSLHKLDHVSRTVREDWTTEDALSGSGEEDQIISTQGGMGTPR